MGKEPSTEPYVNLIAQALMDKIKTTTGNINQTDIVNNCQEKQLFISQGTVSRAFSNPGSMTVATLIKICAGLNLDLADLLNVNKEQDMDIDSLLPVTDSFIQDPDSSAFQGYTGDFYTYFFQTTGQHSDLIEGRLSFKASDDRKTCNAFFTLPTGKTKMINQTEEQVIKNYSGRLIISIPMRAAYCILSSESEICFFAFFHFHIIAERLRCATASVVTVSAGANRRPTVHRMCICDRKISGTDLNYIKGQLLLNDSDILISSSNLEKIRKDANFSSEFISILDNAVQKEKYYSIPEHSLYEGEILAERAKQISLLRNYSCAKKYNKISTKTDEFLYAIISGLKG